MVLMLMGETSGGGGSEEDEERSKGGSVGVTKGEPRMAAQAMTMSRVWVGWKRVAALKAWSWSSQEAMSVRTNWALRGRLGSCVLRVVFA